MIFYGWRKKTVFVSEMPMHSCTRCGTPSSMQLFLNYTSVHLYWIFGVVTNRKYLTQCASCRTQALVQKDEVAPLLTATRVPFMERWGLAVFLASIALIVVIVGAQR
jgi:hypothetical protein